MTLTTDQNGNVYTDGLSFATHIIKSVRCTNVSDVICIPFSAEFASVKKVYIHCFNGLTMTNIANETMSFVVEYEVK
jgi:hypothetical protein